MTGNYKPYLHSPPAGRPNLVIGERIIADCRRRLRELSGRLPGTLTRPERLEMHKLRVFLHLSQTGGGGDE